MELIVVIYGKCENDAVFANFRLFYAFTTSRQWMTTVKTSLQTRVAVNIHLISGNCVISSLYVMELTHRDVFTP